MTCVKHSGLRGYPRLRPAYDAGMALAQQTTQADMATSNDKAGERTGDKTGDSVRAVERALDILLALGGGEAELTVAELLKRVDLSRPTLYRLLYTLEHCGFVQSQGDPQRFRLGPAVGRLSWAWSSSLDIAQVARPFMQQLWEQTRETVAVFTPTGATRLCVAEIPSPQPLSFKRGVGYSEHIVRGASGRALLAWMAPSDALLASYCQGSGIDPAQLRPQLADVRQLGYATSRDELIHGATAIAVPFFDNSDQIAGSIGVFGPDVRMDPQRLQALAPLLLQAAQGLSTALGRSRGRAASPGPASA